MKASNMRPQFIAPYEPDAARVWFYYDGHSLHFYIEPLAADGTPLRRHPISFRLYLSRIFRSPRLRNRKDKQK
jgi:hypothetical protein